MIDPASNSLRVLIVDDDAVDRLAVRRILERKQIAHTIEERGYLVDGLKAVEEGKFDVALVDHNLPDGDAFGFLRSLDERALHGPPVVVMTGAEQEELGLELLAAGAQDYLLKGDINRSSLERALRYAVERHRIQRQLDEANERLEALSRQDPLTEVLNRRGLEALLNVERSRSQRRGLDLVALLIDCDDFKRINDELGHAAGDQVLMQIAELLGEATRAVDHVARIGGDEFLILVSETHLDAALEVAERVRRKVSEKPLSVPGGEVEMTVSIGAANVTYAPDVHSLVIATQEALRQAKQKGKDRVMAG